MTFFNPDDISKKKKARKPDPPPPPKKKVIPKSKSTEEIEQAINNFRELGMIE